MPIQSKILTFALLALVIAGCGTTTSVDRVYWDKNYKDVGYRNILVIGVADNYDRRAQFERAIVSELRQAGVDGTAYYTVIGHNPPVTVSDVKNAVQAGGHDAVLFTRVKGSVANIRVKEGAVSAESTTIGGNLFNLFRYDYEAYAEPPNVRMSTDVFLLTEAYSVKDEMKIWAVETESKDWNTNQYIIDSVADSLVTRLQRDGLIAN